MMQIVMESILIMVVSILLSIGLSKGVAKQIEEFATKQAIVETTNDTSEIDLDITIMDATIIMKGVGIGFGIVIVSSILPMIVTLKKDPKTLLLGRD